MNKLVQQIKHHEGFRGKPYRDSDGHLTIGYGRNLDARPLTVDEATYLLIQDLDHYQRALERTHPIVRTLAPARRAALVNMAYNLGIDGLGKFKRMWAAIERGNWDDAYSEALDSKWARQVGRRALDVAVMLATGEWDDDTAA